VRETLIVNYQTPSWTATDSSGQNHTILTPPVSLSLVTTFKAQGGFGADNPITISAVITDANVTVTEYYCCLGFYNAVLANNPQDSQHAWLALVNQGNGIYTAGGVLEWPDGGPTYSWLLPNFPPHIKTTYNIALLVIASGGRPPTLTIDPISDTLAWQDAQRNTRLSYVTAGLLIIGPYEVVKRLSGRKD
jgi:hypothetical protein